MPILCFVKGVDKNICKYVNKNMDKDVNKNINEKGR